MKDALSYQVQQLLKYNSINVDSNELTFQIKSHPTYPSLHSITGVLDHFNIENLALDVPITLDTLKQLPDTFLAQVNIDSQKQFVIVKKERNQYKLIFDPNDKKTVSISTFLDSFTGIILAVDKDESQLENNINVKTSYLSKGLKFASAVLLVSTLISLSLDIETYGFLILSALGVYVAATILKQEQGESTLLGNAFCSHPTEKKNCNAVLTSKGATLYGNIKLSDCSLIYFIGIALTTLIFATANSSIFIPKLISLIALPITLYSIYYQSVVIKKWCFLCLCIVGIMWMQAGLSIAYFSPNYTITSIFITALTFTSVSAFWLIASKYYKDNKGLQEIKLKHFKFKRNFELFSDQLNKSKIIKTEIDDVQEIIFGNTNSNFHIVLISNPMCGHCKAAHGLAYQILKQYANDIKLTIRFSISPKDEEDSAFKITTKLLELHNNEGQDKCLEAMNEIYTNYTPENWLKKWSPCSNPKAYIPALKATSNWCAENAINFTPEILINGQSYPKTYDRSDLIYFIDDLMEQFDTNNYSIPFVKAQNR
ncbi:vitamin K epoxide reductase family protein [Winogradskyella sp. PE311]|uniref:vitamin K epoxide reductase family protein n=1 Tax=Winogradskyella sp. PE311 TaxID=3366943 RepID=UPI00397F14A9